MYSKVTPCCCTCQQRISTSCCPNFISCEDFDLSFRQINPLTANSEVGLKGKTIFFSSEEKKFFWQVFRRLQSTEDGEQKQHHPHGKEVLLQPCGKIPASHEEPASIGLGVSLKLIHTPEALKLPQFIHSIDSPTALKHE